MDIIKDIFRQYWAQVIAIVAFLAAIARYVQLGQWEQNVDLIGIAALGFVSVIASEEVSEWTGSYGWTRSQWWSYPETVTQFFGALLLSIGSLGLFFR